ncbi:hypothetical protein D3C85_997450 [compost metagenome]
MLQGWFQYGWVEGPDTYLKAVGNALAGQVPDLKKKALHRVALESLLSCFAGIPASSGPWQSQKPVDFLLG